jgi:ERCC4-type nuclease
MAAPLVLVQDTREPQGPAHPWRVWSPSVVLVRRMLPEGDFGVLPLGAEPEDTDAQPLPVAVERKALPDLVACCTHERDRFERCLARLAELDAAVVIVEATEADVVAHCYRSHCSPQSVLASARAFAVDYRVPLWWAGWPDRACQLAEWFLARAARKAARRTEAA